MENPSLAHLHWSPKMLFLLSPCFTGYRPVSFPWWKLPPGISAYGKGAETLEKAFCGGGLSGPRTSDWHEFGHMPHLVTGDTENVICNWSHVLS